MTRRITAVLAALAVLALVAGAAAATPAVVQPSDQAGPDQADRGPSEGEGPPGFVGDLLGDVVPDFVGDLLETLPVPEFVTNLF